jgi:uncharacterized protein (TIGR03437 family)
MRAQFILLCLSFAGAGWSQSYVISTVAGSGAPVTPVNAVRASIGDPGRLATDAAGNVYFGSLHSIFKIDLSGTLIRVAGNGRSGNSGDGGPAINAQLTNPLGIAFDAAGNMYVADRDANVVRKIATDGTISTVAGTSGELNGPFAVAVDAAGNIYVSDTGHQRVARYTPDGRFSSVGDGLLNGPEGLAIDSAGNLYIADTFNGRIRKLAPDGTLSVFAGTGTTGVYGGDNNPPSAASFSLPTDVAVDRAGNVYVTDFGNDRVRKIANGVVTTVAGDPVGPSIIDGQLAVNARFVGPTGVAVDRNGVIYVVEGSIGSGTGLARGDFRIYRVAVDGTIRTFAGTGAASFSGDGAAATSAQLSGATGVAVDAAGNLYIADTVNQRLRKVAPNGTISTIAGTGAPGFAGDNVLPAGAQLNNPRGVTLDPAGRLYLADSGNSRVRRIDPGGNIVTLAGNGNSSYYGDGLAARQASVNQPEGVAADAAGNVYIADTLDNVVRKVAPDGSITTIAGFGTPGFSGDGGPAVQAALDHPRGIAVTADGIIYIADTGNNRVRKVDFLGTISTVVEGLSGPRGIAVDRAGTLYIADTGHNQVLRGSTIIAGAGPCCYSGDGGFATAARLNAPWGIAVDGAGNVYVADSGNNAVRVLRPVSTGLLVTAVTNAASNQKGAISPGEVVSIYGGDFAGVQSVLFNGLPAPLLYVTNAQVGAVVPYGLSTSNVQVVAQSAVATSAPLPVALAATAPGIFTSDGSGAGQAAAVNQDGSTNGPGNPAAAGSVITFFATGEGQTTPAGVDGKIGAAPLPRPLAQVQVTIGGMPADVRFAGGQQGVIAGVMQVNAVVPAGLSGSVPLVISVGGVSSQPAVTVTVQ